MNRERVFDLVNRERLRQDTLKAKGRFKYTPADDIPSLSKLAMLCEEVREVAGAVIEEQNLATDRETDIEEELIHVAAIAVAWLESLPLLPYHNSLRKNYDYENEGLGGT